MDNNTDEKRSEARLLTRLHSRLKLVSTESTNSNEGDLIDCVTRDISFAWSSGRKFHNLLVAC